MFRGHTDGRPSMLPVRWPIKNRWTELLHEWLGIPYCTTCSFVINTVHLRIIFLHFLFENTTTSGVPERRECCNESIQPFWKVHALRVMRTVSYRTDWQQNETLILYYCLSTSFDKCECIPSRAIHENSVLRILPPHDVVENPSIHILSINFLLIHLSFQISSVAFYHDNYSLGATVWPMLVSYHQQRWTLSATNPKRTDAD